ncbi:hypothetical protein ALQ37_102547 [Pseudomonas syringae pv. aptata]|uniref:Uncharacterized protein n=1 Tax=Pseudomonas syringae pv. aptata TaxID=83167 RepID=A0A0Q0DRX5_PSEAP|nr:hypothetical protein ALO85_101816 [Pseudomonas syringae pv. aptata]RMN64429.1 hypothetical protein ALQ54_101688 [Pseudomonas syringae]RMO59718.1 hypothetical protein ALQ37_102547 [Pseudomonas syringae pv. aptata]
MSDSTKPIVLDGYMNAGILESTQTNNISAVMPEVTKLLALS